MTAILLFLLRWGTGQDWIPAAALAEKDREIRALERRIADLHYAADVAQGSRDWEIELRELARECTQ